VLAAAEAARQPEQAPEQDRPGAATAAPTPDTSGLRGETVKLTRLRKVIATRMVESLQVSAQLTTVVEVDVTRIARLRARVKGQFEQREGVKLSFLPFFAKASVEALKAFPMVNASIDVDAGTVQCLPAFDQCSHSKIKRYDSHDLKIGMRWLLASPMPVVYEQPIIRKY